MADLKYLEHSRLKKQLIRDEGWRNRLYTCPAGKLTIGVGFNLEANRLCDKAISAQLDYDIERCTEAAKALLAEDWDKLNDVRQEVLIQMIFQLGVDGVRQFRKTLAAIRSGDFDTAAYNMLASRWAKQTPTRVKRLAKAMKQGIYE